MTILKNKLYLNRDFLNLKYKKKLYLNSNICVICRFVYVEIILTFVICRVSLIKQKKKY